MLPFVPAWGPAMNKPERLKFPGLPKNMEAIQEGDSIVLRRIVDMEKFRRIAVEARAYRPRPKKGASISRDLRKARERGGRI